MDSLQPTIVYEPPGRAKASRSRFEVSQPDVGLVAGSEPKFADETARLLRGRLMAATFVLSLVLGIAFVANLVAGVTLLWWLRGLTLLVPWGCFAALRWGGPWPLARLRSVELLAFGAVIFQLALLMATRLAELTVLEDAPSLQAVKYQFIAAWCVVILIYGIFMPNSWQRGAGVMIPMAAIPYIVLTIQRQLSPELARLLDLNRASMPIPPPLVAALISTYGAHVIHVARREAFQARRFGQYRLLEKLGGGGMGVVHKAEHVLLKRPCAIKLIKPEGEADASAMAHFEKEVQATARLTHWNTIEIYDYGHTDDGTFYYVMELLSGMSLEELVTRYGPLPPARAVHLLRQICGALQEAHGVGLIHRDIKPANIFAARRGGVYDVAKLLDFGLVKELTADRDAPDRRGSFSGTPLYMSPEQASAYDEVDRRADIYSLGAVAYFLLTGQTPFSGSHVLDLVAAHAYSVVTPPSHLQAGIPDDVEQVVLNCLAKKPQHRYPDAAFLEQALGRCACAAEWTAQRAAEWWTQHEPSPAPGSGTAGAAEFRDSPIRSGSSFRADDDSIADR